MDLSKRTVWLFAAIAALATTGCVDISLGRQLSLRPLPAPLVAPRFSAETEGTLAAYGYGSPPRLKEAEEIRRRLAHAAVVHGDWAADRALAEFCLWAAREVEFDSTHAACDWYWHSANAAARLLFPHESTDPSPVAARDPKIVELHNEALANWIRLTETESIFGLATVHSPRHAVAPAVLSSAIDVSKLGGLLVSSEYHIHGMRGRFVSPGLGVPVIGLHRPHKEPVAGSVRDDYFFPDQAFALTAVLAPGRNGGPAVLRLYDPIESDSVVLRAGDDSSAKLGEEFVPLASDTTVPLGYWVSKSPLRRLERIGIYRPDRLEDITGLYSLRGYEPGKIPVVFVHGFWSSPRCWAEMTNRLLADRRITDRYQFWYFLYPTGSPLTRSAKDLRQALRKALADFDPESKDPALSQMVLVGHSLGGLLAKLMISESGDELWRTVSNGAFEDLVAPDDVRADSFDQLFFSPEPYVSRVVFIATPHDGIEIGNSLVATLTEHMVSPPWQTRDQQRLKRVNPPDYFSAGYRDWVSPSIDQLSQFNRILRTIETLPQAPAVPLHSIIGVSWISVLWPSDGVVPYRSASIPGVESELVIRSGHGCQDDVDAIEEVRRILMEHSAKPVAVVPASQ